MLIHVPVTRQQNIYSRRRTTKKLCHIEWSFRNFWPLLYRYTGVFQIFSFLVLSERDILDKTEKIYFENSQLTCLLHVPISVTKLGFIRENRQQNTTSNSSFRKKWNNQWIPIHPSSFHRLLQQTIPYYEMKLKFLGALNRVIFQLKITRSKNPTR
jgi:hypothetical protein